MPFQPSERTPFIIQHNCVKSEIGRKWTEGGGGGGVRADRGCKVVSVDGHSAPTALGWSRGLNRHNDGNIGLEIFWTLTQKHKLTEDINGFQEHRLLPKLKDLGKRSL